MSYRYCPALTLYQSVIAFTDGAVEESGIGSIAAIVLPLENNVPLLSASHVFSLFTCSLKAEITAISLAMELTIEYFKKSVHKKNEEKMFVLTDRKRAISCIVNQIDQQYYTSVSKVKAAVRYCGDLATGKTSETIFISRQAQLIRLRPKAAGVARA